MSQSALNGDNEGFCWLFSRTGILRHQAANYNLEIKNNGYVLVSDLLKLSKKTAAGNPLFTHTEADVCKVILTLVLT